MTSRRLLSTPSSRWIAVAIAFALLAGGVGVGWWVTASATADAAAPAPRASSSSPAPTPVNTEPPAPRADGFPAATAMGVNELRVRDLPAVLAYYRDAVGLDVLEESPEHALLGRGVPLISLVASDEPLPQPTDAGLYHTAILYPDAPSLAEALAQVAENAPESYQGAADHRVSEAFYFGDPEGNGLELYLDRPRDEWEWADGKVRMGSEALDPNAFMQEHLGQDAAGTATMGHVHLKVGDLDQARAFYADTLGFDVVSEADGALFYSAGGYHHHLATNTWQSAGAGPRSTGVGLGAVTIVLPDTAAVDAVAGRLDAASVTREPIDGGIATSDPWGNVVRLVAGA